MNLSEEELSAAHAAMSKPAEVISPENNNEPPVNPPVTTDPVVPPVANTVTPPVATDQSSLNDEPPVTPIVTPTDTPEPVKSWEEIVAEKTGGKKWEEIEAVLNAPPKEVFANETVKRLNQLALDGVEINNEILALQTKDYSTWTDPEDVMIEAMKLKPEGRGLSDETLQYELNKKYNIDEWREKEESDYTVEDRANVERFKRDALNDRDWLVDYRESKLLVKPIDPTTLQMQADARKAAQASWEGFVDKDLVGKVSGFNITVDEASKEAFEYKISESDRREVGNLMKLLPTDSNVMFSQFSYKGEDGKTQINHQKVYEMLVKSRLFDDAVKNAFIQGKAVGAKNFVKDDLKNVSFTPNANTPGNPIPQSEAEALAAAMKAKGIKF